MNKGSESNNFVESNQNAFAGSVAIVTGSSRGIGKALAIDLGARGSKVVCAARATDDRRFKLPGTINETVDVIEKAGGEALAIPTDLSNPDEIKTMVETTHSHFGGIDILVNNAAVTFSGDIDIDPKRYKLIMDINVYAPLLASLYARSHLAKSSNGRILNISSIASLLYVPTMMAYGMSKAALDHLTVSTAAQFKDDGIAVNGFRIDAQVATEGYMMNAPDEDFSSWVSSEQAAGGMCWMLEQPPEYTAHIEDMVEMGERTGSISGLKARDRMKSPWRINP